MAKSATARNTSNQILAQLSAADFALLKPDLKIIDLPVRFQMEEHGKLIKYVYFIERGIVSVVANGLGKRSIEIGIIGSEGMTGFAVIMGADRAAHESFVQFAGSSQRVAVAKIQRAIDHSVTLHRAFLRYGNSFVTQTARTAVANWRSKIEERLARWLLMAHDRIDGDEMPLTHEFLSLMLGVRRAGVTKALNLLQSAGLIGLRQKKILILDRRGLEKRADGTDLP
jgi:CRP-like cAMP-binding protein